MGNRACIIFHNHERSSYGPNVYLHWHGGEVGELVKAVKARMGERLDDEAYTTARLIGLVHEMIPGNLSLGVFNLPADFDDEAGYLRGLSPGDAGIFLVDCQTWDIRCHGGYGLDDAT